MSVPVSQDRPSDEEIARALALRKADLIDSHQFSALTGLDGAALRAWVSAPERLDMVRLAEMGLRNSPQFTELSARKAMPDILDYLKDVVSDDGASHTAKLEASKQLSDLAGVRGSGGKGAPTVAPRVKIRINLQLPANEQPADGKPFFSVDYDPARDPDRARIDSEQERKRLAKQAIEGEFNVSPDRPPEAA